MTNKSESKELDIFYLGKAEQMAADAVRNLQMIPFCSGGIETQEIVKLVEQIQSEIRAKYIKTIIEK